MFLLTSLNDVFAVEPADFNKDHEEHLKLMIQNKFIDRVIYDVGLIITFYDFLEIKEAKIYAGDGRAHFKVDFRMVAFRPFIGEILEGIVVGNDSVGLQVSMEFFQDIRIPLTFLREPKGYDQEEKLWWWDFQGYKLHYTKEAAIRFRVTDIHFNKKQRTSKEVVSNLATTQGMSSSEDPPMGAVNEDGLGLKVWWE